MKGYNYKASAHPFEEDLTQIVNDWEATKPSNLFKVNDDGWLYVWVDGQSNPGGQPMYTNPDGFLELFSFAAGTLQKADPTTGTFVDYTVINSTSTKSYFFQLFLFKELIDRHGLKIRFYQRTNGGSSIVNWEPNVGANWFTRAADVVAMGGNWQPCTLAIWGHGESDRLQDYAWYAPKFYEYFGAAVAEGWINTDHRLLTNEVCNWPGPNDSINEALFQIADENSNYNISELDGITFQDSVHFEPNTHGLVEMGRRYYDRFIELVFGFTLKTRLSRPTAPVPSITTINADNVVLSWTAASATEVGATIIGYIITAGVDGLRWRRRVGNVLTFTVPFTVASTETEKFGVIAIDSNNKHTTPQDIEVVSATRP